MRAEKKLITAEYVTRLNAAPFFLVVDYRGLNVLQFTELRKRLARANAEVHVVKNSIFRAAAREAGVGDLNGLLNGQLAVITGSKDVSAAAKMLKNYQAEFEKPKTRFGYLDNRRLEAGDIQALADLPSIEVLRSKFLGLLKAPATRLVCLLNTPASQLARVLKARADKESAAPA
ncbi:MAG: 50S ribosomal protein L10 [Verrucomicrobia bacterium]|nr:50S ribosomal protein L10 [Verrucomicrobiota bacterium]